MSLLFNTMFRFVIAFLPRSKCLLISWLQLLSAVILECQTLCDPVDCSALSFSVHHQLLELKLMSIQSVIPSNHLILYCPLLFMPSIFRSIRIFSSELALHIRWPMYWSFSFIISPSNEYSGLISLKIDWFDLLAFQK